MKKLGLLAMAGVVVLSGCGGDDDDDVRPPIHDVPQKLEPIHFRHPQIGDKNIRAL